MEVGGSGGPGSRALSLVGPEFRAALDSVTHPCKTIAH